MPSTRLPTYNLQPNTYPIPSTESPIVILHPPDHPCTLGLSLHPPKYPCTSATPIPIIEPATQCLPNTELQTFALLPPDHQAATPNRFPALSLSIEPPNNLPYNPNQSVYSTYLIPSTEPATSTLNPPPPSDYQSVIPTPFLAPSLEPIYPAPS